MKLRCRLLLVPLRCKLSNPADVHGYNLGILQCKTLSSAVLVAVIQVSSKRVKVHFDIRVLTTI